MDESPGIAKLFSVLLAGEYAAYQRLITESAMAPDVAGRIAIGRMAASEMGHFDELSEELVKRGLDPTEQVLKYVDIFDRYHGTTNPKTWDEVMVKAYVGDGLAADFYGELADALPKEAHDVVSSVMRETGNSEFARDWVRARVAAEPELKWPLTLWGRRLLGEAITHTQWVLAAEEDVTDLLFSGGTTDLAQVSQFFDSVTERHAQRMADLGLG
ncbi:ferritin-like fold-containing protein [Gordonia sp. (in: high G+C Gram-positive bacteria)]|uniref:ferritin-like fold-containing protein n=1 Tax=Gordonia sp. (in: high G+C Gram-positive bacteria) TaxID=84139 RepID=UPI0039E44048